MTPQISVLLPVWNGCRAGEAALRMAVESVLDQTFEDLELIAVNDGSTDNTGAVLQEYQKADPRVRVIGLMRNKGIVNALNTGLDHCRAPYTARQDADDYSAVTRLAIQKDFLDNRPGTAMCGTGMYVITHDGKLEREVQHPCNYAVLRQELKRGCFVVHGSVMYRTDVARRYRYSEAPQFRHAEDYELWVRMAKDCVIENIPEKTLYFHRNHPGKIGNVHAAQQEAASRLIMSIAASNL